MSRFGHLWCWPAHGLTAVHRHFFQATSMPQKPLAWGLKIILWRHDEAVGVIPAVVVTPAHNHAVVVDPGGDPGVPERTRRQQAVQRFVTEVALPDKGSAV